MKYVHIMAMAIITFCWIWSLPLLIIGALFAMPFVAAIFITCILISCYLQYVNDNKIIINHWLRTLMCTIPWAEWFPCNTLKFNHGVIAVHPHGVLCCGALAGIHFVPGSTTCLCIAPIVFYIPIIGWIVRLLGCIPADKSIMIQALHKKYPLLVVPGGVPEIVMAERGDDEMRFKRHGFLRIANQTKQPVHIVYAKGECATFKMFKMPLFHVRIWLAWKLNIPCVFPVMLGWFGSWIPKRTPISLYCVSTTYSITRNEYEKLLMTLYKKKIT